MIGFTYASARFPEEKSNTTVFLLRKNAILYQNVILPHHSHKAKHHLE